MSYEPTVWQDHVTEYPGEYIIKKTDRGTHTIAPAGKVIQEGTPQNANNFNKIEEGLVELNERFGDLPSVDAGGAYISTPKFVNSVDEMTDTDKVYVLASTGRIYAYMNTTVTKEVTEKIEGTTDNPYYDNSRLSSDGSVATSASDYAGYVTTPYIDLTKYPVPFTLHLDGAAYILAATESYTRLYCYDADKAKVAGGNHTTSTIDSSLNVADSNVVVEDNGNSSITFVEAVTTNTGAAMQYVRFSGKGTSAESNIYVTYETEVSGEQWVDTGISYVPEISEEVKSEIAQEAASLIDTQLLTAIGEGEVSV